jgi:hypothetical protein
LQGTSVSLQQAIQLLVFLSHGFRTGWTPAAYHKLGDSQRAELKSAANSSAKQCKILNFPISSVFHLQLSS